MIDEKFENLTVTTQNFLKKSSNYNVLFKKEKDILRENSYH